MEKNFVELNVVIRDHDGRIQPVGTRIFGVAHIAMVSPAGGQPLTITLANGTEIEVRETYDDLKRLLCLEGK